MKAAHNGHTYIVQYLLEETAVPVNAINNVSHYYTTPQEEVLYAITVCAGREDSMYTHFVLF